MAEAERKQVPRLTQEQCMRAALALEVQSIKAKDPERKAALKGLSEQARELAEFKQMIAEVNRKRASQR